MEHIVQKIASDWNCLGPHHSLNVRLCMVNVMKELLSFQGVGGCLLELLLDQLCCAEIALVGLNENLSLLNNFERKKTYTTRENIASVIIQHITLLLVSQATSKVIIRKCLIKVSSTFKHAPRVDRRQRFCFYTDGVADCFSTQGLSFEFVHGVHIDTARPGLLRGSNGTSF